MNVAIKVAGVTIALLIAASIALVSGMQRSRASRCDEARESYSRGMAGVKVERFGGSLDGRVVHIEGRLRNMADVGILNPSLSLSLLDCSPRSCEEIGREQGRIFPREVPPRSVRDFNADIFLSSPVRPTGNLKFNVEVAGGDVSEVARACF